MSYAYVDESIHERGDLIVSAIVVAPHSLDPRVNDALLSSGFQPGVDEFKSSMTMHGNERAQDLRLHLRSILTYHCKIGVVVSPVAERNEIARQCSQLLTEIAERNDTHSGTIYVDQGIRFGSALAPRGWGVAANCDSRLVKGIQVADCAAHLIGTMLLSELGIINKTIPTDGTYPEPEVEMAWQHWTWLRYALHGGQPVNGYDDEGMCEPLLKPYGLRISEGCSSAVRDAAERRLGAVWVGCIH